MSFSGLAEALIPPFSLQPLVENAVQHGLQSSPKAGCLRLVVRRQMGEWLDMSISDDGQGVPSTEVERVFFAVRPRVHALSLLRRRLQGLFGRSFRLEVGSEVGRGTMVRMRIPFGDDSILRKNRWKPPVPVIWCRARIGLIMGIRIRAVMVQDEALAAQ